MAREQVKVLILLPACLVSYALQCIGFGFWIVAWVLKDDGSKELFQ